MEIWGHGGITHFGNSEGKGGLKCGSRPWYGTDIFWNRPIRLDETLTDVGTAHINNNNGLWQLEINRHLHLWCKNQSQYYSSKDKVLSIKNDNILQPTNSKIYRKEKKPKMMNLVTVDIFCHSLCPLLYCYYIINRWPVRALDYHVGGLGFEPQTGPTLRALK